ncbi:MAG: S26 family signal peptidase, partial [Propionibacteriaceae bacterium]|nr:S26 family signal peptidase [Propionibacteriaceae bacterium]
MTASTAELPARALTGTAGEPRGAEAQTAAAPAETQAPKKKSVFKRAISWVTTMLMVALLGLGVVLAVIPAMHGGTALTVLTGSMTPTIQPGDIAVVYAVDGFDDVEIGDIVTFMP